MHQTIKTTDIFTAYTRLHFVWLEWWKLSQCQNRLQTQQSAKSILNKHEVIHHAKHCERHIALNATLLGSCMWHLICWEVSDDFHFKLVDASLISKAKPVKILQKNCTIPQHHCNQFSITKQCKSPPSEMNDTTLCIMVNYMVLSTSTHGAVLSQNGSCQS